MTFVRNAFSTALIFAITPWIAAVGIGNFFLTFSMLALASILSTIIFLKWGKKMRYMSAPRYARYAACELDARAPVMEVVGITT